MMRRQNQGTRQYRIGCRELSKRRITTLIVVSSQRKMKMSRSCDLNEQREFSAFEKPLAKNSHPSQEIPLS